MVMTVAAMFVCFVATVAQAQYPNEKLVNSLTQEEIRSISMSRLETNKKAEHGKTKKTKGKSEKELSRVTQKKAKHVETEITKVKSADELALEDVDVTFESCGNSKHAMKVKSVHYDPIRALVTAVGTLSKHVKGGNVTGKVSLGENPSMSVFGRLKTISALAFSGRDWHREDFCKHISRGKARYETPLYGASSGLDLDMPSHTCPLSPGEQLLHFSLHTFPKRVMAGAYELKVNATGRRGTPLVCLLGKVVIPEADDGTVIRKLTQGGGGGMAAPPPVSGAETTRANLYVIFGLLVLMIAQK